MFGKVDCEAESEYMYMYMYMYIVHVRKYYNKSMT